MRSVVESRNAPALVGPTPARATAPSSASQSRGEDAHEHRPLEVAREDERHESDLQQQTEDREHVGGQAPRRASTTPTL